ANESSAFAAPRPISAARAAIRETAGARRPAGRVRLLPRPFVTPAVQPAKARGPRLRWPRLPHLRFLPRAERAAKRRCPDCWRRLRAASGKCTGRTLLGFA